MYDVIIIGAGPAGLTAGIYCIRADLKTLVLESQMSGGQIATAERIENYPGFPDGITGMELADRIREHAEKYTMEADCVFVEVEKDPNTAFLTGLGVETDEKGYIVVDSQQRTNIKGLFAAGDVTSGGIKQVTITVAHGCTAALSAHKYLRDK
ncbi:MAG: FAD-dependent oxidoreductase [Halobacteriota archaeon]|nr:FAD-dependent oxidoreductase [Halobacteriota archaeon]